MLLLPILFTPWMNKYYRITHKGVGAVQVACARILTESMDAVKVTFQLKSHILSPEKPTFQLKSHIFSVHIMFRIQEGVSG